MADTHVMTKLVEKIVKALAAAIKNMGLYPIGHPAVQKSMSEMNEAFSPILKLKHELIIAVVDNVLVVAGNPCYDESLTFYKSVREAMSKRGVEKIVFSDRLEANEVMIFLQFFQETPAEIEKLADPNDYLSSRGVRLIEFKKVADEEQETKRVYKEAIETVGNILTDVRLGKVPDTNLARQTSQNMIDRILKDRNTLIGLTNIKNYDNYLFNHSVNVAILTLALAKAMNIYDRYLEDIGVGAMLHDIGKTTIPLEIINKPGKLNDKEWIIMQKHPIAGLEIVAKMKGITSLTSDIVYQHHINYSKGGYPELPQGRKLNPLTRVISIADSYDAITTLRVYQRCHSPTEAIEIMKGLSGKKFDPDILREFFRMLGVYPQGALVRLDTNELAVVCKVRDDQPLRPVIKIIRSRKGEVLSHPFEVDLGKEVDERGRGKRFIIATVDPLKKNIDTSKYIQ